MRPAIVILGRAYILDENGTVASTNNTGEGMWIYEFDAKQIYIETIEFFTLALKTLEEYKAKKEEEKKKAEKR